MNRFRAKKKAKEMPEGGMARVSTDSDLSIPPVKKSRTFGRTKKNQEPEPKQELDLAHALPPSDDFRTSLLMSGLSARFSMLREQDDPNSKIGKASDDSVLFPKRQSKFNDFTFASHGLSDIAEVSSIHGSVRPPFASATKDSSTEDDGGSIMSRAKPGEGNNLFGGRQKVYKIPNSMSAKSVQDGGMGGRALYDHDVSQSAFQRIRERERNEEQERMAAEEESDREAQVSRPPSPPLSGYNRNRETSSTTSSTGLPSINTRTSTAATSFTSQRTPSLNGGHTPITPSAAVSANGPERSVTKTRRLYENGLDQHLHEQQHSAMSRIDTLSRQRNMDSRTPPLNSPVSAFSPVERWDRHPIAGKASMPNMRAASPPPNLNPLNNFDFAVQSTNPPDSQSYGMSSPPLSPPFNDRDEVVLMPIRPNDFGKATASGAFSRPMQGYDEGKYSQRQIQMQNGRDGQSLRKNSPPRAFAPRQPMARSRGDSNATFASGRSRSNSSAQRQFLPPAVPDAQPQMKDFRTTETTATGTFLSSPAESIKSPPVENEPKGRASLLPLDLSKMNFQDQNVNLQRPPESQHPANRQRNGDGRSPRLNGPTSMPSFTEKPVTPDLDKPATNSQAKRMPADSPTLGPTATMSGLNGMVRQHLRSDSGASSIYGGPTSNYEDTMTEPLASRFPVDSRGPMTHNDYNSKSNPWGNESWDQGYYGSEFNQHSKSNSIVVKPLSVRSPIASVPAEYGRSSWEREPDARHTRDGSTETQKEREDFKMDLAERRRRVQENLKSFVETESRSSSPVPDVPKDSIISNSLGMLKSKSSLGSLAVRTKEPRDPPGSKAMKMLGIGGSTMNNSVSPDKQNFYGESRRRDEDDGMDAAVKSPGSGPDMSQQTKAFRQARRDAQRDRERQLATRQPHRTAGEENGWLNQATELRSPQREQFNQRPPPNIRTTRQRTPSRERHPPPVTYPNRSEEGQGSISSPSERSVLPHQNLFARDRSSSSERSKGRNGPEFSRTRIEGASPSMRNDLDVSSTLLGPKSPGTPATLHQQSPGISPLMPPNRKRSDSRQTQMNFFESNKLQPLQNGVGMDPLPPRPSPTAPFVINPTPVQPAPGAVNNPSVPASQSQPRAVRKKSVNKSEISEPKFVSSTSRITTVNLPPEASLLNGMEFAPPIPPVNPARRQTRGMFGLRKKDEYDQVAMPAATQSTEEMSTFSADEDDSKPRRQRLRKSSSEGGNLNAKARQAAFAQPSPAMPSPNFPSSRNGSPPRPIDGGMF